jgi:hypothetical protein
VFNPRASCEAGDFAAALIRAFKNVSIRARFV